MEDDSGGGQVQGDIKTLIQSANGKPRLLTLCQRSAGRPDGIRDYTVRLVEALEATGLVNAELAWRDDDGSWSRAEVGRWEGGADDLSQGLRPRLANCDTLLLQYNPFLYGRRGFAPWLPLMLLRLRISRNRPRIALMVHEPFVPMISWRWALMGMWQRLQLAAIRVGSDLVFVSIEAWAQRLRIPPRRTTFHLPVGSNVPDGRHFRSEQRRHIGAGQDSIVLGTFGQNMRDRGWPWIVEASNSLARTGHRVILLNLGAGAPPVVGLDSRIVVHTPGDLPAGQLSRWLSTVDIYLAPYVDGASTRRTTVMAAMQHGLPIVAIDGPSTDTNLRTSGALRLVRQGAVVQFLAAVRQLAGSPEDRRALGNRARDLYEQHFDWPVIAHRVLTLVGAANGKEPVAAPNGTEAVSAPNGTERSVAIQAERG